MQHPGRKPRPLKSVRDRKVTELEYLLKVVNLANQNNALLDGTMGPVRKILDDHDVVVAVWQDRLARDGVGTLVVKGDNIVRDAFATGIECRLSAIPCKNVEQALALKEMCGATE